MPITYTNVAKPTGPTYTRTSDAKPSYDESAYTFDSSSLFYDGYDPNQYTKVTKPTLPTYTNVAKPT